MLLECCTQYASKFGKLSSGHRTGKGVFIPIPKKDNAKECSNYRTIALISHASPHSSTLTWKIPWTEEPGALQSMGSLGVRHNWTTSLTLFTFMHWRRKWQPTPVFLPGESQGQWSLVGCRLWGRTVRIQLKWLSSSSSNMPANLENSAVAITLEKVSFHSNLPPKKAMPKNVQTTAQLHSFHMLAK